MTFAPFFGKYMNQTKFVLASLSALLLTACGGGNDSPPATTASKMAPYVGTWVGECDGRELPYLTIGEKAGVQDTATYTGKSEFYSQAGCTGTVVATATYSANFSATYNSSTNANLVIPPATAAVTAKIDHVTLAAPAYSYALTGPGVTRPVTNGQAEWCIAFGDGTSTCFRDEPVPAGPSYGQSVHLNGSKMYIVLSGVAGYGVSEVWTRK